jgi:hypothetical protein
MTGRQRCDEILRLIDEALAEPQPFDVRIEKPALNAGTSTR